MESMSTEFCTVESTLERIDTSEIDGTFLMQLLDESTYVEEETDEDDRLRRVIQSLEAEIGTEFDAMIDVDLVDYLSDLDSRVGSGSSVSQDNYSFEWMEVESEEAKMESVDMASWYNLEDELVEYGDMREYNSLCYNVEDSIEQEYCSLWE